MKLQAPILETKKYKHNTRKFKVNKLCTQMLFTLPITGNKNWDEEWFRFFAGEYTKFAHMKKRRLNKYQKQIFIEKWLHKVDRFYTTQNNDINENRKYAIYIGQYIQIIASGKHISKNSTTTLFHGYILTINEYIKDCSIQHDKSTVMYWRTIREYLFNVLRAVNMIKTNDKEYIENGDTTETNNKH